MPLGSKHMRQMGEAGRRLKEENCGQLENVGGTHSLPIKIEKKQAARLILKLTLEQKNEPRPPNLILNANTGRGFPHLPRRKGSLGRQKQFMLSLQGWISRQRRLCGQRVRSGKWLGLFG